MHFVFLIQKYLCFSEENCKSGDLISKNWSEAQLTLTRHLKNAHGFHRLKTVRWCGFCNVAIPVKISSHKCLQKCYFDIPQKYVDSQSYPHQYLQCKLSFPTGAVLSSHSPVHAKKLRLEKHQETSLKQHIKKWRQIPDNLIESDEDPDRPDTTYLNFSSYSDSHPLSLDNNIISSAADIPD